MTYHPWREAARLDVLVEVCELPTRMAWWVPGPRVILLDARLTQAERRSALTHELCHIEAGDYGCDGLVAGRWERAACREAARRLISAEALAEADLWCHSVAELAEELWVDEPTLRTRIANLTRADRDVIAGRRGRRDEEWGAA